MKLGVQVELFIRSATLLFIGAIMQFLGVKSPLEENAEFSFSWNISGRVRNIEKKFKQKLHPFFISTKPRKNNFRKKHIFQVTPPRALNINFLYFLNIS